MKKNKPKLIAAIDELIYHYAKHDWNVVPKLISGRCPLCIFDDYIIDKTSKQYLYCNACPWTFFKEGACNLGSAAQQTTKQRLARLNRWKKRLK